MDFYVFLWVFMGFYGFLWVFMDVIAGGDGDDPGDGQASFAMESCIR
jgi:hypothetical protein